MSKVTPTAKITPLYGNRYPRFSRCTQSKMLFLVYCSASLREMIFVTAAVGNKVCELYNEKLVLERVSPEG